MLDTIKTALESTGKTVFYGQAGTLRGDDIWDYIVFFRNYMNVSTDKTNLSDSYRVVIVQEEFIDDATIYAVIDAMLGIPGMRIVDGTHDYNYTRKPNTGATIEMLTLDFIKPKKRCGNG